MSQYCWGYLRTHLSFIKFFPLQRKRGKLPCLVKIMICYSDRILSFKKNVVLRSVCPLSIAVKARKRG